MFAGKPIIGLAGGIGSGKSFIAQMLADMGCCVIDSDQQVREAYERADVRQALRGWWGDEVTDSEGRVDRAAVGKRVFADAADRHRLERMIHPLVAKARESAMRAGAANPRTLAFVWDSPLLIEAGLADACDAIIFVDTPLAEREKRVRLSRGWSSDELARRENSQLPLDKKRQRAHYVVQNTADAASVRDQLRQIFPQILAAADVSG